MVDTMDKPARSRLMAAVRSKGNGSTEGRMVKLLRQCQITGWRRHMNLPGRPDFSWRKQKVAIFVDGCFWHGCPRCYNTPKSNIAYWTSKIERNRERDREANNLLQARGWMVLRIWECELAKKRSDACMDRVAKAVRREVAI